MPRNVRVTLTAVVILLVPVGAAWAQTSTSTSTTSVTTTTTAVPGTTTTAVPGTTTTLPICFPLNPTHQLGVTCQLPGIDCPPPNPPPPCGNFPNPQPPLDPGTVTVVVSGDPGPTPGGGGPAAPSARLSLTG